MELITLDKKDWDEIRSDLKEIRKVLESQGKMTLQKKWYNTKETAEYLHCAVRTVYHYCNKGLLNPKRIAGILLFDSEEIEALISKS